MLCVFPESSIATGTIVVAGVFQPPLLCFLQQPLAGSFLPVNDANLVRIFVGEHPWLQRAAASRT